MITTRAPDGANKLIMIVNGVDVDDDDDVGDWRWEWGSFAAIIKLRPWDLFKERSGYISKSQVVQEIFWIWGQEIFKAEDSIFFNLRPEDFLEADASWFLCQGQVIFWRWSMIHCIIAIVTSYCYSYMAIAFAIVLI